MRFRVLGPLELRVDDRVVAVGPPQQRLVVAALAIDAGRTVTTESLIDGLWDAAPPGARRTLYVVIARIRRLLERESATPVRLLHRSGGYVLDVDPDRVDLHRFRRLIGLARDPDRLPEERVARLREAMALWVGEPLANLPGEWAARTRQAWWQEYIDAVLAWAEAELRVGNPGAVIVRLTALTARHPLVEPLTAALMRALYAAGRPADALEQYLRLRTRLVDDLGSDPGPEVEGLYRAVLRGDVLLPAFEPPVPAPATLAQLPAAPWGFVGRARELAHLDGILARDGSDTRMVVAVSGTAGVGKTALAVHWSHQVRERFPDGQLYVNLCGFDPIACPVSTSEALGHFLGVLGVPPDRIPTEPEARTGMYRSALAGKRVLVLVDNARDAEHARPLLPGAPRSLAVVTSRSQLTGLVASDGARTVALDVLSADEARDLLAQRLGSERIAAEPEAIDRLVKRCSCLPLALTIVAARVQQTGFPVAAVAAELDSAADRLNALDAGDPRSDVRAVFSSSYRALTPDASRLFRLLSLHPGPDVSVWAAASLAATPVQRARTLLAELTRANLIAEREPGRHRFHHLLHVYAADLVRRAEAEPQRAAAARRLRDHYVHTAHRAASLLEPCQEPAALEPPQPGVVVEAIADRSQALDWLVAERDVLLMAFAGPNPAIDETHYDNWMISPSNR